MLAETCIASSAFIDGLQEKAVAGARSAAEEAIRQRKASQAATSTFTEGGTFLMFSGMQGYSQPSPAKSDGWG